jgi:hypothetical protein
VPAGVPAGARGDRGGAGLGAAPGASASGHRILAGSVSYGALWRLNLRMRAMMVVLRLAEQVCGGYGGGGGVGVGECGGWEAVAPWPPQQCPR